MFNSLCFFPGATVLTLGPDKIGRRLIPIEAEIPVSFIVETKSVPQPCGI